MSDLKKMYSQIVQDDFPNSLKISLGDTELEYERRTWDMDGEIKGLRYGENPDQPAALYALKGGECKIGDKKWVGAKHAIVSALSEGQMLQAGKHPGKTNLTDVDNAVNILRYLTKKPAVTILKHNNPCGAAWADNLEMAMHNAFWSDRIAAFGGAVVMNTALNKATAELISSQYFEVVAAPEYEDGVLEILKNRKNLRILKLPTLADLQTYSNLAFLDIKSLMDGGLILQQSFINRIRSAEDFIPATAMDKEGNSYATRVPSKEEVEDLLFAWAVEAGVTSNSIIFVKDGATVGIGTGEQDRVGCVELTIHKAYTKYADKIIYEKHQKSIYEFQLLAQSNPKIKEELEEILEQTAKAKGGLIDTRMVSDGFFPFRDGIDTAATCQISAIAQPGGSLRDYEVINACNEKNIAMLFTGQRSFKH